MRTLAPLWFATACAYHAGPSPALRCDQLSPGTCARCSTLLCAEDASRRLTTPQQTVPASRLHLPLLAGLEQQEQHQHQQREPSRRWQEQRSRQQHERQQQPATPAAAWGRTAMQATLAVLTAVAMLTGDARGAFAENELAALANSKSTSELVDPQCFASKCQRQMETCAADGDCMKGLLCSAKCMGDAQCTVGCFARYNDKALEDALQCTIEDAGCIAIATQTPGADSAADAPKPPVALVKATPASMQGKWYKVLGFNPNYDCYDCQRNSFSPGASARPASREVAVDVGPSTAAVEVEYTMPRSRIGQPTEDFKFVLNERLEFDADPASRRTAHTQGRMFGLTFWENWYVIGQNQPREPEYRFVYYTGKTLQNRYEGAFVYARKPELPQGAMPSIYRIAREAGFDPQRACCIDNSCFGAPVDADAAPVKPLFTPVAEAGTLSSPLTTAASSAPAAPSTPGPLDAFVAPLRGSLRDLAELLEDPRPPAAELFSKQRPMYEVREYDANGFRVPVR